MSLILRPYQEELIVGARNHFKAKRKRVLLQLTCRGGKTAITIRMFRNAIEKGKRAFFNVHRRELIAQVEAACRKEGLPYGIVAADSKMNLAAPLQICSIPTLANRADRLPMPDLVGWDECHHIGAKSWEALFKKYENAYHIGLSATPMRGDEVGLGNFFEAMVCGPSAAWMMEQGYISKYELYRADNGIDTSQLHRRMGEYISSESEELVNRPAITGNAISHYRKHCDGAKAVAFCVSIKHSKALAEAFREAGIPALHVDGDTHKDIRAQALKDLLDGKLRVVTNVDLFGEGVDLPGLEAGIYLRPTTSRPMHIQQLFRPLTAFEGKPYSVLLDCVGNTKTLGLPDDDISWELTTGRPEAKNKPEVPSPRICSYCFGASRSGSRICRICNRPFPVDSREVDQVDGELSKVEREREKKQQYWNQRAEQADLDTKEALVTLGQMRGMKNPEGWAKHVIAAREAKKAKKKREQAA